MALFKKKDDWKEELEDQDKAILTQLLNSTKKHRWAYSQADDVKVAQLWTALIEMKKELDKRDEFLLSMKYPWLAIVEMGNVEKKKTIEKLVKEVIKPADDTTKEAVKELVESLMKF